MTWPRNPALKLAISVSCIGVLPSLLALVGLRCFEEYDRTALSRDDRASISVACPSSGLARSSRCFSRRPVKDEVDMAPPRTITSRAGCCFRVVRAWLPIPPRHEVLDLAPANADVLELAVGHSVQDRPHPRAFAPLPVGAPALPEKPRYGIP